MPSEEYEIAGKERYQHVYAPDYDELCRMRTDLGVIAESFLALKEEHDPFYAGLKSHIEDAKWFKEMWDMCGYASGMHLRRMHYQLVSQEPKIKMRNGKTYENTDACWKALGIASLAARYLEYVDPANFDDRRNGEVIDHADYTAKQEPSLTIRDNAVLSRIDIDALSLCLPDYAIDIQSYQPYHLELWCEKSTQDDILVPLAEEYKVVLRHGMGELSVTIALVLQW
jgi:hypothetical protein